MCRGKRANSSSRREISSGMTSWAAAAGGWGPGLFWRAGAFGGAKKENARTGVKKVEATRRSTRAAASGGGREGGGGGGGKVGGGGGGLNRFIVAGVAVGAVAGVALSLMTTRGGGGLPQLGVHTPGSSSSSSSPSSTSTSTTTSTTKTRQSPLSAADAAAHRAAVDMWNTKWEDGAIGFHLPRAHHQLVRHKTALLGEGVTSPPEHSKRVFVPLCGKAVDMLWLAACGHRVFGVDLSGVAAAAFFAESGLPRWGVGRRGLKAVLPGQSKDVHRFQSLYSNWTLE